MQRWNAVVDLIVRKKFHGWGPPHEPANLAALPEAAPGAEEDTRDPWIRQSLTLSMSALRRLATAARVAGEVVDAALDSPNPKEEIVKHVMLRAKNGDGRAAGGAATEVEDAMTRSPMILARRGRSGRKMATRAFVTPASVVSRHSELQQLATPSRTRWTRPGRRSS